MGKKKNKNTDNNPQQTGGTGQPGGSQQRDATRQQGGDQQRDRPQQQGVGQQPQGSGAQKSQQHFQGSDTQPSQQGGGQQYSQGRGKQHTQQGKGQQHSQGRGKQAPQQPQQAWGGQKGQSAWGTQEPQSAWGAQQPQAAWGAQQPQQHSKGRGKQQPQQHVQGEDKKEYQRQPQSQARDQNQSKQQAQEKGKQAVEQQSVGAQHPQKAKTPQQEGSTKNKDFQGWPRKNKDKQDHTSTPEPQVKESSQLPAIQKVTQELSKVKITKPPGTGGIRGTVDVNYVDLNIDKLLETIYHYDIRIDPMTPKKNIPFVFEKFRLLHLEKMSVAFDGKNNVYLPKRMELSKPISVEIGYKDSNSAKEKIYKIEFKETKDSAIDLTELKKYILFSGSGNQINYPMRAAQCLEIILKMAFQTKGRMFGHSVYMEPRNPAPIGNGYNLWNGLYQSLILGSRPYLNIDITNKGFSSNMSIIDLMYELRIDYKNPLDYRSIEKLNDALKRLDICYTCPNKTTKLFKFNEVKQDPVKNQVFVLDDGKKTTIFDYFRQQYKYILKFPHLPCLWVGNTVKNIYLPIEMCSIAPGQPCMKMNAFQTSKMIRECATSTDERKNRILSMLQVIDHNTNQIIKDFGITVGGTFKNIASRILSAPGIQYTNQVVDVRDGVWNGERSKFLDGKQLTNWAILKLNDRFPDNMIEKFANMVTQHGNQMNMNINPKFDRECLSSRNIRDGDIDNIMERFKKKNIQLVFVIIPNFNDFYPKIKQSAELRCGILTQCVKEDTLFKRLSPSTVINILLKINSKLNGTNHKIDGGKPCPIISENCMIVGADVTHPTGDNTIPSVVGVAASYDKNAFKYCIGYRIQNPKQEMITDLKAITAEQLSYYKKMNGKLPDKILYYRDGVSDGQFQEVLSIELTAIYAACREAQCKPKVSFIVVQKRHHTRFFPAKGDRGVGKHNNVKPGTIVDSDIVDPHEFQFFLVSHASIQGVARPTKYCILHDDNNISANDFQTITYNLCHLFTRCNRAVSYVAPTYYAHHAAARGKVYIQNARIDLNNLKREFEKRQIRQEVSGQYPMFFV